MKISDVEKFTGTPNYKVNVPWSSIDLNLELYDVNVDPDFQRGHVWSEEQQISYIEFRIRGGMSGREIYINSPRIHGKGLSDEGVLVDGKQRITAVQKFMKGELPIFGGYFINDFEDAVSQFRGLTYDFVFAINNLQHRSEVLKWYIELNSGGVLHTKEEIARVTSLLEEEMTKS